MKWGRGISRFGRTRRHQRALRKRRKCCLAQYSCDQEVADHCIRGASAIASKRPDNGVNFVASPVRILMRTWARTVPLECQSKGVVERGLVSTTPTLRFFDWQKAAEVYVELLGFKIDWEHRLNRLCRCICRSRSTTGSCIFPSAKMIAASEPQCGLTRRRWMRISSSFWRSSTNTRVPASKTRHGAAGTC